ncbi:hypothetical protein T492DRAFT_590532, partial [Pavlovales sp. CCMP2436]
MVIAASLAGAAPRSCAVIGGGISGLSCAQRLQALGIDATVFDTGKKAPGGRASSRTLALPNGRFTYDHAAQFFTATGEFAEVVRDWEAEGVVRKWDRGLGVLDAASGVFREYDDNVPRWIGTRGMFDVVEKLTSGLRVRQDIWISPDGTGVQRVDGRWKVSASGKTLGIFDSVAIAHNGKCAERLSGGTGAKEVRRLLRARFAPAVRPREDRLVLNSLYSLLFVLPKGAMPAGLSGARVVGSDSISFITAHDRKRPDCARALGPEEEAWTVISTAAFGTRFKAPQESIPKQVEAEVIAKLLAAVAATVKAAAPLEPRRTKLQLWGAGVPLNCWRPAGDTPPCAIEPELSIGACGDWLREPTIQGAWESGRALADAL